MKKYAQDGRKVSRDDTNLKLYPCALILGYPQDFNHISWSLIRVEPLSRGAAHLLEMRN